MSSTSATPSKPDDSQALKPVLSKGDGGASPRVGASKVVSIAEPESISPVMNGRHKEAEDDDSFALDRGAVRHQHRAKVGKRLQGRPPVDRNTSSQQTLTDNPLSSIISEEGIHFPHIHRRSHGQHENVLSQVSAWLKQEKARRAARKEKRRSTGTSAELSQTDGSCDTKERRSSDTSEGSTALESLENILEKSISIVSNESRRLANSTHMPHRPAVMKRNRRQSTTASSDTEYLDGDAIVPSCDAVLDNSRTLAYSGGEAAEEDDDDITPGTRKSRERQAWATFKYEIVRLSHTLRLKGWRKVPMEKSSDIEVERLSGALTNAVYVVSPPKDLPPRQSMQGDVEVVRPTIPPPKLLLRIYGPQVEHLIDRESELQILKRLARKRIGPRLLGTFSNGRFEEFFHARTLTPNDLRNPDTSMHIAKRMRELHEGIDLLSQEREDGPFVWRNWDKWVDRCELVTEWLDAQIINEAPSTTKSKLEGWRERGFVCGTEWKFFRQTLEKYRKWLEEQYGGAKKLNERLVFAHNDTQYGNILRLVPSGHSPLLLPSNEHKQLVVIDFEYANANTPGLEFANHFTEWCYNYHDPERAFAINTRVYPTPKEQHRFIRSYVTHRPFTSQTPTPSTGGATPTAKPGITHTQSSSSSISAFMLDSRTPPQAIKEAEEHEEREIEAETQRLMAETRLWRMANSSMWVAWGIVQAKVPGMPDLDTKENTAANASITGTGSNAAADEQEPEEESYLTARGLDANQATDPLGPEEQEIAADLADKRPEESGDDEEFDYLAYAQERAMFFWGDAVHLGIVKKEELPEGLRAALKIVEW
ncbi:uncharacterized protein K452DRAFT_286239 [Aplosporella prunicola CBS 121167]|uniref:Choline kinase N-terminal domain-containing protein n=1 Tax=Aplosporella prunicola CBS 121167 TaxID=1176127 RepID=A0A6A6BH02_9PEZI|nr:uncharacterized protein K452DRAFT_286239 [Aplosporella prunicola CBS 121167]KAF2143410.1 hypothetical protein K452DRAFT_286239 [Aplosporella prunicola CBS 121167]